MKKMTEENVKSALAGESQAHVKYAAFALKAEAEKLPNIARVFKANSYAEQVHATNYVKILGALGSTKDNLDAAVGGESFEIAEMYPAYIATAQLPGREERGNVLQLCAGRRKGPRRHLSDGPGGGRIGPGRRIQAHPCLPRLRLHHGRRGAGQVPRLRHAQREVRRVLRTDPRRPPCPSIRILPPGRS